MAHGMLGQRIEDLGELEQVAEQHGYPLVVLPEYTLGWFTPRTVTNADELQDAFAAASSKSPTATVCVRRP